MYVCTLILFAWVMATGLQKKWWKPLSASISLHKLNINSYRHFDCYACWHSVLPDFVIFASFFQFLMYFVSPKLIPMFSGDLHLHHHQCRLTTHLSTLHLRIIIFLNDVEVGQLLNHQQHVMTLFKTIRWLMVAKLGYFSSACMNCHSESPAQICTPCMKPVYKYAGHFLFHMPINYSTVPRVTVGQGGAHECSCARELPFSTIRGKSGHISLAHLPITVALC